MYLPTWTAPLSEPSHPVMCISRPRSPPPPARRRQPGTLRIRRRGPPSTSSSPETPSIPVCPPARLPVYSFLSDRHASLLSVLLSSGWGPSPSRSIAAHHPCLTPSRQHRCYLAYISKSPTCNLQPSRWRQRDSHSWFDTGLSRASEPAYIWTCYWQAAPSDNNGRQHAYEAGRQ